MIWPVLSRWTRFWSKMMVLTENDGFNSKRHGNSFFTPVNMVWPVLTQWTRFWQKMTVLTRNVLITHFLSRSTRFDPYWPGFDKKMTVLTRNVMITHFLSRSTWFDPYWPGWIDFDKKWRFWPKMTFLTRNVMKTHFLPWLTWVDPYWPGEIGFLWKMTSLIENDGFDPKRHENSVFYPSRHGLTCIDPVKSVFMERCSWLEKTIFWILNFFFWIFMNNNRNRITFKKILVNQKLGYDSELSNLLGKAARVGLYRPTSE